MIIPQTPTQVRAGRKADCYPLRCTFQACFSVLPPGLCSPMPLKASLNHSIMPVQTKAHPQFSLQMCLGCIP